MCAHSLATAPQGRRLASECMCADSRHRPPGSLAASECSHSFAWWIWAFGMVGLGIRHVGHSAWWVWAVGMVGLGIRHDGFGHSAWWVWAFGM
eukprot:6032867-Alexandrium_andersonii.AAC.1